MQNIEKYALLITDTVKEVFVLFLALAILLNYLINIAKKEYKLEIDKEAQELDKTEDANFFFNGLSFSDITRYSNVAVIAVIRMFMKNSSRTSMFYFIYILCMYLFIQQVAQTKVFDQISWSNIYNDFMNKTIFVFSFPFIVFTLFTLIYVTLYLLYKSLFHKIEWSSAYYGFTRIIINVIKILFCLLFVYSFILWIIVIVIYSIIYASNHIKYIDDAHRLSLNDFKKKYKRTKYKDAINLDMNVSNYSESDNYTSTASSDLSTFEIDTDPEKLWHNCRGAGKNFYLTMVNTIHYLVGGLSEPYKLLNKTTNSDVNQFRLFNVILLALLVVYIIFISFVGVGKVLLFNLYSTFLLDFSKILTLLLCVNVDMGRIFSFLKILVALFILYNIRNLFQYVYFVFGVVVFIIMTFFILKELNTIKIESCEQFA